MTAVVLAASLSALAAAGLAGALLPDARVGTWLAVAASAGLAWVALASLGGAPLAATLRLGPPPFVLTLGLGPVAALMLLLIQVIGVAALVYGDAYVRHLSRPKRAWVLALTPLFLAAMSAVVLSANAAAFLVAWEIMSLTSFALVMTDGERREVTRAGFVYLVMTHAGTACLAAAFLILANATGTMEFVGWGRLASGLPPAIRSVAFVLLLVGFGSKAALVPLHVWLPRAHPAAPSHVSGLMSGVMLKVAIYGVILTALTILGAGPLWWGVVVLGLGLISAVLGVLYALMEHDLKRLLAYHSVENIGIIAIGLGVALIGQSLHLPLLAAAALTAALLHTVNHALFKTALFLDAGAIQHAGAGRNLDHLGGLLHRMPWTGISLLVAAAAIAGLPPLNGFVSEWLTYQSLVHLAAVGTPSLALAGFAGILGLALTGGLAAACFAKVSGTALLGRAKSPDAAQAREVPAAMFVPPLALAGLCLGIGLLPGVLARPLAAIAASALPVGGAGAGSAQVSAQAQAAAQAASAGSAAVLALPWGGAQVGPLALAGAALVIGLAVTLILRMGRRSRPQPVVAPAWACGGSLGTQSQYSATGYAKSFRLVFSLLYRPVRSLAVETAVHPAFRTRVAYTGEVTPIFDRYLFRPGLRALLAIAGRARRLQSGSLRVYLGYMLVTLVLLLVFVH